MNRPRRIMLGLAVTLLALLAMLAHPAVAPATIAEQRARLPPPADCPDPVIGTWKSHAYYPGHGQWYIFTLTVQRVADNDRRLEGQVHSHYWTGGPGDEEPPPCGPGGYHQTVIMPASGTAVGFDIEFGGDSWRSEQSLCGSPSRSYYPDRFRGTIDPAIDEFQSVNNDGGPMVNYPTVFRRVSCLEDGDQSPGIEVVPPPAFYPDTSGCGCRS